jgi:ubiquinone biosynthesis protein
VRVRGRSEAQGDGQAYGHRRRNGKLEHDRKRAPGVITMSVTVLATSVAEVAVRVLVASALAVVTTRLALRLLGVQRGWAKALVAGAAGWAIAGLLALGLNGWDWGADGLVIQTLAIAVPATMAIAVGLDLAAPPGSLARPEAAGMLVAPRPLRAVRRRVDVIRRYRELLGLLRAQGFGPMLGAGGRAERAAEPVGVRLRRVLEAAGGVYVKLGQIGATRVDLLPPDVCAELAKLQSDAPTEPAEGIRAVIEAELGRPVEDAFPTFDWEPLAAASIGQTHTARLASGEAVVVKVQRPGIAEVMERDIAALALLAHFAERRTPLGRSLGTGEVLDQFARSLRAELDFTREARATADMGALTAAAGGAGATVRIPRVHAELCTARVLVQERLDGVTADRPGALTSPGLDRRALATTLLRTLLRQILQYGFFHADPHPGNVIVLADGSLGLIDFGAVGRLDPVQRAAVVDMVAGVVRQDVPMIRSGIEAVAEIGDAPSADRLDRAIARVLTEGMEPGGTVSPDVLQSLVPMLGEFGIRLPGDLVLLSRALVTLDGTLGVLSPGLSVMAAALEVAGPGAAEPIVDPGEAARAELAAAVVRLRHLPDHLDRTLALAARGDLRLRTVVAEDEARVLRTLVNRALLTATGAAFVLASAVLLAAANDSPAEVGGASIFEILGYGGLLAGSVLLLRVVAQVARDGTS